MLTAELIIFFVAGIITGTFTGITPGIHTNLIAILMLPFILKSHLSISIILIFIVAMAVTHTFVDFIPAIFFGAPDEDTGLSVLPGHDFLLAGQGHHALKLTLIGSTIATISLIFIAPFFIFIIPKIYPFIQKMMGFFLIWISILLIYGEKKSRIQAIIIFALSGFLGISTLNLNMSQPLLPLFTGLFGTSTIIHSIKSKTQIPKQSIEKLNIHKRDLIKPTLATIFISPICSFFPGLGSSQAAVIGSKISGDLNREQFLILMGSINTLVLATSFITLFLVQKSRTGIAFAISQITHLTTNNLYTIMATVALSTIIAIPISLKISKTIAKNIHKIEYIKISLLIVIFLFFIITYFSGVLGLLVLIVSTLLGLTCIEFQTRRSFLMGAILIPTIIYYLPF